MFHHQRQWFELRVWSVHKRCFTRDLIDWCINSRQFFLKIFLLILFRFHPIVQLVVKVEVMKLKRRRNRNFEHHHFSENVKKKKKLRIKKKLKNEPFTFVFLSRYYLVLSCSSLVFFFCRKFCFFFFWDIHSYIIPTRFLLYVAQLSLCVRLFS